MPRTIEQIAASLRRRAGLKLAGIGLLAAGVLGLGLWGAGSAGVSLWRQATAPSSQLAPASPPVAGPDLAPATRPVLATPRTLRCDGLGPLARPTWRPCQARL